MTFCVAGRLAPVPFVAGFARVDEAFAVEDAEGFADFMTGGRALGDWFAAQGQGRGHAMQAAKAVLQAWFQSGGGDVVLGSFEGNVRSARVLTRPGFVGTGRGLLFCRPMGMERPHGALRLAQDFAAGPNSRSFRPAFP